jgi:non-specific serine/threonine protein kinase
LLDSGRADEGLRLAVALVDFWQYTDRIGEGRAWLDRALFERTAEDALRAEALFQAGLLAFWRGDDEATLALHQPRSLGLARRLGEPTAIALALTGLARVELRRDIERARTLCLEALEVVDGTGDQRGGSSALHVLGVAAQMRGQFPEARGWMSQRLELAREMGDLRSVAAEAGNLSVVEQQLGDLLEPGTWPWKAFASPTDSAMPGSSRTASTAWPRSLSRLPTTSAPRHCCRRLTGW